METGAFGVKYQPLAPESTISVSLSSKIAWSFFFIVRAVRFSNFRRHFGAILADLHMPTGGIVLDKRAAGLVIRLHTEF